MRELSEEYPVPGIGSIRFRKLTPIEFHLFIMPFAGNHEGFYASFVAATACDDEDTLIFTKDDIPRLQVLPAHLITPLGVFTARFNGINI